MSEKKELYRHGDVVVYCHATIPESAKPMDHKILAWGEKTGHKHQITEGNVALLKDPESEENVKYLRVDSESAALTHEEHGRIDLPKGDYEFRIQREYQPNGWSEVLD